MRDIEHYVTSNVETFCNGLNSMNASKKDTWGAPKKMSSMANYLTFDILAELCFGQGSIRMLNKQDHHYIIDSIFRNVWRCMICGHLPIIHTLGLDKCIFPSLAKERRRFMEFSKTQAEERTKPGDSVDRKDFFHYLLNAKDLATGQSLSMPELWAESNLLIIAGSDTPATAIAGIFYYLSHNPSILDKLQREIHSTFNTVDDIQNYSSSKLAGCKYFRAVIDETMRMSPPVTGTVPREVLKGGAVIDGELIPEGTILGTGFHSIHHNPDYFADPFTFRPERWILSPENNVTSAGIERAQSGFFPFSFGPRGCIGRSLAYMEMNTVIARTVWLFDMRLSPESTVGDVSCDTDAERKGEFMLKDRWQAEKDGPMVEFKRRAI